MVVVPFLTLFSDELLEVLALGDEPLEGGSDFFRVFAAFDPEAAPADEIYSNVAEIEDLALEGLLDVDGEDLGHGLGPPLLGEEAPFVDVAVPIDVMPVGPVGEEHADEGDERDDEPEGDYKDEREQQAVMADEALFGDDDRGIGFGRWGDWGIARRCFRSAEFGPAFLAISCPVIDRGPAL